MTERVDRGMWVRVTGLLLVVALGVHPCHHLGEWAVAAESGEPTLTASANPDGACPGCPGHSDNPHSHHCAFCRAVGLTGPPVLPDPGPPAWIDDPSPPVRLAGARLEYWIPPEFRG